MSTFEVAFRYAKALLALASTEDQMILQLQEIQALAPYFSSSSSLLYFLRSPQWTIEEKNALLQRSLGKACSPQILSFLQLLLVRGKMGQFPQIVKRYRRLTADKLGLVEATLVTAKPLQEEFKMSMQDTLSEQFQKTARVEESLDPSVMGGIRLIMGNQVADDSVKGKFTRLKNHLLREGVS